MTQNLNEFYVKYMFHESGRGEGGECFLFFFGRPKILNLKNQILIWYIMFVFINYNSIFVVILLYSTTIMKSERQHLNVEVLLHIKPK